MKIDQTVRSLLALSDAHAQGDHRGMVSVCSVHPVVIESALIDAAQAGQIACIECTSHQVNQQGGATGLTPAAFRAFVEDIAARIAFPPENILFGGDHLGPDPWRHETADVAMEKAIMMVRAYAQAGFGKLHLDASMSCLGDPAALPAGLVAKRNAKLAKAAEDCVKDRGMARPAFIICAPNPVPDEGETAVGEPHITTPAAAEETLRLHREAFAAQGQEEAFGRVAGLVVRPGIAFGHADITAYDPAATAALIAWRARTNGPVFEAHATDHQSPRALAALVQGGFAILKSGPALTFALRQALYSLDHIAAHFSDYRAGSLQAAMETAMRAAPAHWKPFVEGTPTDQAIQRHYGYTDLIGQYWATPKAQTAVDRLFAALEGQIIPLPLINQYMPGALDAVQAGTVAPEGRALAIAAVRAALAPYRAACAPVADPQTRPAPMPRPQPLRLGAAAMQAAASQAIDLPFEDISPENDPAPDRAGIAADAVPQAARRMPADAARGPHVSFGAPPRRTDQS